jgi:hypothetical protein
MTRPPVRKRVTRSRPQPVPQTGMALHTVDGARKYLTVTERDAFLGPPRRLTVTCGRSA